MNLTIASPYLNLNATFSENAVEIISISARKDQAIPSSVHDPCYASN
jgi:hypothetical protein